MAFHIEYEPYVCEKNNRNPLPDLSFLPAVCVLSKFLQNLPADCVLSKFLQNLPAEDGDRRRGALAVKAELNETREVVLNRGCARAVLAANTVCGDVRGAARVDELNLTERAASRHYSLAHILEDTRTRGVDGGEERIALVVVGRGRPRRSREGALRERAAGARTRSEGIDNVLEGRKRHVVALLNVNLLDTSLEGSHFVLYIFLRKYFWLPEKKQPELEGLLWKLHSKHCPILSFP